MVNWLGCAKKYFKTSYVIVYHVPSTLSSDCSLYFKTSYVIVYLPCDIWHCGVFKISKHLNILPLIFYSTIFKKINRHDVKTSCLFIKMHFMLLYIHPQSIFYTIQETYILPIFFCCCHSSRFYGHPEV